ncbi:helix-turn-helix domain-containing protein [Novosphingobium bradum]|uniref:Helix-turn-helix domain-containing protein n=1 Tax=Novosphingobium bradum TaxID=1737444 RepID=A0ABV7IRH5_9SPHN
MDIQKVVGNNLRTLRTLRGWSQEEFAERSGIHRTYISGVERGLRNPTVTVLAALARALDIAPAGLLEGAR